MVPNALSLPPVVSHVRTAAGKALFENLYLPPLPPGVKPLNSFGSLHDITFNTDPGAANSRYVGHYNYDDFKFIVIELEVKSL